MKRRLWLKIVGGIVAGIMILLFANTVMEAHHERVLQAEIQAGLRDSNVFGPKEIWQAASPLGGLMNSLQPRRARLAAVKATLGIDLQESPTQSSPQSQRTDGNPLKLIRTGQVAIEVSEFEKASRELGKMVESSGGYIADTQVRRKPSGAKIGTISLRVPAASYESVGSRLRTLGKVMSENSNVQDVTKAYADLETRLRVKREALNRIRELLRSKAGNLKEVLEAEKEIARITEEIEQAEGERRFFDHQIALSTITVELSEPEPISLARPSSWWALSESLRDSAAMVAGSLAFMLRLLFILLPWALVAWGIVKGVKWMRGRKNPTAQAPPTVETDDSTPKS